MYKFLVVCLFLTGCSLTPPNAEVCAELPSGGAFCRFTISGEEKLVSVQEWDEMSVGRFSLNVEDFGEYQKFIKEACEKSKCNKKQKKTMRTFSRILDVRANAR